MIHVNRLLILFAVGLAVLLVASTGPAQAGDCVDYRQRRVSRPCVPAYVPPADHFATVSPVVATFVPVAVPVFSAIYEPRVVPYGYPNGVPAPGLGGPAQVGVPAEGQPQEQPQPVASGQPLPATAASSGNEVLDYLKRLETRLERLESGAQGVSGLPFDFGGSAPTLRLPPSQVASVSRPVQRLGRDAVILSRCASCHDNSTAGSKGGGIELTRGGRVVPLSAALSASVDEEVRSGRMPRGRPLSTSEMQQFLANATASR